MRYTDRLIVTVLKKGKQKNKQRIHFSPGEKMLMTAASHSWEFRLKNKLSNGAWYRYINIG